MADDQSGTEPTPTSQNTGFSEDYVKSLRDEAASWRTKFRELQSQTVTKDIEIELAKHNIKAKPSWVEIQEGQTVQEAVETFKTEFPHLAQSMDAPPPPMPPEDKVTRVLQNNGPNPITPPANKTSSVEYKDLNQLLSSRSLDDAKQDPKTREQVRDWYRSALRNTHNS